MSNGLSSQKTGQNTDQLNWRITLRSESSTEEQYTFGVTGDEIHNQLSTLSYLFNSCLIMNLYCILKQGLPRATEFQNICIRTPNSSTALTPS